MKVIELAIVAHIFTALNCWSVSAFSVFTSNHLRQDKSVTALQAKRVSFKEDARRGLVSGINQVADAVRVTLGPKVRNMIDGVV
jgi:hypothetical protein